MEGNWHLCCLEDAVGFCLRLCNCRLRSWGVIAILAAPVLLFCWWCCLFLWIRRLQSIPKIARVQFEPMRSGVKCVLEEKTFWKKYQFYNHCKVLTQQGTVLSTEWNRKQGIKISRFCFQLFHQLVFGGKQAPSFPAFASCRQGRAVKWEQRCPVALRLYSDGQLWWIFLWRHKMINPQASENTYDLAFGPVSVISLMSLLISCNVHQAVSYR